MHQYECAECGEIFTVGDEYLSDPQTRQCPYCLCRGNILYHGYKGKIFSVQSDSLGHGVKGVKNHADGKRYDSKSEYYKALKAHGCVVAEPDSRPKKQETKGDFDCKKELKEAYEKVMSNQPKKRKRK